LYHNLLLFVLPAYYAAATLDSPNALFLSAVAAGALVTAVDPWFRRLVRPRRALGLGLFAFSIFAALNVALPLVGVRPVLSVEAGAAPAALPPPRALRRAGAPGGTAALRRAAGLAVLAALLAWAGRHLVPPAPLFIARAVAARAVSALEPVDVVPGSVPAATVAAWGGLTVYTAVYAPGRLGPG